MADTVHTAAYNSTEMSTACTLAISTLISKGFTIKSSPPILIAIKIWKSDIHKHKLRLILYKDF